MNDPLLDRLVYSQIQAVGHLYGQRTLHGLLRSQGVHVSQRRLCESMSRVAPAPQNHRTHAAHRHLNPPVYTARFLETSYT
jgi:hypothetical protein